MDFSPKKLGETETFTWDFVNRLATGETILSASISVSVLTGTDASPSSTVSGSATISGTKVLNKITGGVVGVYYAATATAITSTGQTIQITGNFKVVA